MQNFAKMVILQQQPLFACSRPSKIRGFMAFKRLISSQQQQCTQLQCCHKDSNGSERGSSYSSMVISVLCPTVQCVRQRKGSSSSRLERKNFSCTFSMHSCSWLDMESFLLFVKTHEISCVSQFHQNKNSRRLFMASQLQECMEEVQLKSFLSSLLLLLLLPFPCLTHCTLYSRAQQRNVHAATR